MANNIDVTPGTGKTVKTTEVGGFQIQNVLIATSAGTEVDFSAPVPIMGANGTTIASNANPVPISDGGGSITVDGSVTAVSATAANLNAAVVGTAADDAAVSGNPVQVGGKYSATAPTLTDGDAATHRLTTKGNLIVGGITADDAAAPAAASDYPVPVGGVVRTTPPSYADGDRAQAQFTSVGSLKVSITNPSGNLTAAVAAVTDDLAIGAVNSVVVASAGMLFDTGNNWDKARQITAAIGAAGTGVAAVAQAGASKTNITTATTTQVKSGAGILSKVIIGTAVSAATISIYDATSGTTNPISVITCPATAVPFDVEFNCTVATGIRVITSGATDVTVVYW